MPARAFRLTPVNPPEIDRQAEIVRYLLREPRVKFFIRVNGGGRFIKGAFVWFYKLFVPGFEPAHGKGVSDLIGQLRDGRFFAIEIKKPGARTDKSREALQAAFLTLVAQADGAAGIAENWQDAKKIICGDSACQD